MGEGLREVPQVLARRRVDLLRVEQEGPGEVEQLFAEARCPFALADHRQGGHEPEGADGERALFALEAGVGAVHFVPQDETVLGEFVGDGEDGVANALVLGR